MEATVQRRRKCAIPIAPKCQLSDWGNRPKPIIGSSKSRAVSSLSQGVGSIITQHRLSSIAASRRSTSSLGLVRVSKSLAFLAAAFAIVGTVRAGPSEPLSGISDLYFDTFRADVYIQAAVELQAVGREGALRRLHAMALDRNSYSKVIILCRMLFAQSASSNFRAPLLGMPMYLGGTNDTDWPTAPIEVVDGVPFLITSGYLLAGKAESAESYLRYSESDADWSGVRYTIKTTQEKQDALTKLLASPKWKTWDDAHGRVEFFSRQIK
jgi:hypothetical protein